MKDIDTISRKMDRNELSKLSFLNVVSFQDDHSSPQFPSLYYHLSSWLLGKDGRVVSLSSWFWILSSHFPRPMTIQG